MKGGNFLDKKEQILDLYFNMHLKQTEIAFLLQNAMFIAGIATLIQLYPIWKIGSRLPIVMGVSFTFVAILTYVGATYDSWVQF